MIVKESAVSQKNNLMNKILLFLLGGCIIGSAITIFSAQNKHKKIPTQQNAESKQNTQQEDRISTISPNILLGFHLGMSKLEYNSIIVIIPIIGRSSSGMSYSERIMLKRNIITNIRHPIFDYCIWNNDMLQFFQKEKTKSMIIFKNAINL